MLRITKNCFRNREGSLRLALYPKQEVAASGEVGVHPGLHHRIIAHAVPHHVGCIVGRPHTMGVDTDVCGSLGIAALSHKHLIEQHDAVESRSSSGCHHVVACAAVYLGTLCLGRYHVEQLATQHLAVAHHRGIEQTDKVAVGSATVVAHLGTGLGERHRSADTHHVLTDSGALLLELRRQPDVVLVANGDEVGCGTAHG